MTPKRKNQLIKLINQSVKEIVEEHVSIFEKPFICQDGDGSFGVSTTTSFEGNGEDIINLPWVEFERFVLRADDDEIAANIPRFERLVCKMKRRIKPTP